MTLKDLPIGKTATIRTVGGEGALRQHFLDMGIIPKAEVTIVKYAPMGDPDRSPGTQLRADPASGRCGEDRDRRSTRGKNTSGYVKDSGGSTHPAASGPRRGRQIPC